MPAYTKEQVARMSPRDFRNIVRNGEWTGMTLGACHGYVVSNLAVVPKEYALDFLTLCNRNPKPCPVIDVTDPGDPHPRRVALDADLRTDLPRYRVFKYGEIVDEPTHISNYWREDLVGFLLGCSRSLVYAFEAAGIPFRAKGGFRTNIELVPAGRLHGRMYVTARLFKCDSAAKAIEMSARHPLAHGTPVHIGDPAAIGIKDICKQDGPDMGDRGPQGPDEIAMFWGCGVTPQLVAEESNIPLMITHISGHLFVTDRRIEELTLL